MKFLKTFEQFDSPDLKGKFKNVEGELKDLANPKEFKNKFKYNFYNGENSYILNQALFDAEMGHYNTYGLLEQIYNVLIQEIPDIEKLEIEDHFYDKNQKLSLGKKVELDDGRNVIIELVVNFNVKDDEIFEYKKDTINLFFSGYVQDKDDPYGQSKPDKENMANKKFKLKENNLSLEQFVNLIPRINAKLFHFTEYIRMNYKKQIL